MSIQVNSQYLEIVDSTNLSKTQLQQQYLEVLENENPDFQITSQYLEVLTPYEEILPNTIEREFNHTLTLTQNIQYQHRRVYNFQINQQLNLTHYFLQRIVQEMYFTTQVTFKDVAKLTTPKPLDIVYEPLNHKEMYSKSFKIIITWDTNRAEITRYFRRYRNNKFHMLDLLGKEWFLKLQHDPKQLYEFARPQENIFTLTFYGTLI